MNHLKSYKLFESSMSFDEIKGIIDDILVDLKDLNGNFSWKVLDFPQKGGGLITRLAIYCHDDVSNIRGWTDIKGWTEILDRLFGVLISEDLKIYDQQESFIEVKPGKINLSWIPEHIMNPMTFEYESSFLMKSFILK